MEALPYWIEVLSIIGGAFLGAVIWFIRLESRVKYQDKELLRLTIELADIKKKHEDLDTKLMEKLSTIEKTLARICGKLEVLEEN